MTIVARLMGHYRRPDGNTDTYWSTTVPLLERPMTTPRGSKARRPSRFVVLFNGRWHRVYLNMTQQGHFNAFIGHQREVGERINVDYLPC